MHVTVHGRVIKQVNCRVHIGVTEGDDGRGHKDLPTRVQA